MKTDYEQLGGEALERLEISTKNADTAQTKFLLDWLNENKNTEYLQGVCLSEGKAEKGPGVI